MSKTARPLRERFERMVARQGECWLWTAYCNPKGQPRIKLPKQRLAYATHIALGFVGVTVPPCTHVEQTCGNKRCVNPEHQRIKVKQVHVPTPKPVRMMRDEFEQRVDRRDHDECWPWLGVRNSDGYGVLRFMAKAYQATHLALEYAGVDVPAGLIACHHCDNPSCVNPRHLFVGTHRDNALDCKRKGRGRYGPNAPGTYSRKTSTKSISCGS